MRAGQEKCSQDSSCYGITYPSVMIGDKTWLDFKRGVAVCRSRSIVDKPEKDWNVYAKTGK